ncbi:MAG: site-2 protease family protein [Candidatus Firestonebacteria bacterium]|nr:site-2 protease family protein [Candidatus Firestonebacteria bacterium]
MDISLAVIQIPVLIFAVVIHESAHGWMADKCGDPTARILGRITLNPIPHIDLMGSVLLPLLLFISNSPFMIGYAKPVPVNFRNLRNPKRDAAFVGMAGPISNILIAFLSLIFLKILYSIELFRLRGLILFLISAFQINIVLAAFNLIPIPPLDGSRLMSALLTDKLSYSYSKLEPYGFVLIMGLMMFGLLDKIFSPLLNILQFVLHALVF